MPTGRRQWNLWPKTLRQAILRRYDAGQPIVTIYKELRAAGHPVSPSSIREYVARSRKIRQNYTPPADDPTPEEIERLCREIRDNR